MSDFGDTTTGPCSWCGKEIVKIWRRYHDDSKEGYWSEENCSCGTLFAITGPWNKARLLGNSGPRVRGKK